jgi:hypothetical protein
MQYAVLECHYIIQVCGVVTFIIIHDIGELELADSRGMGWKGGTTVTGLSGVTITKS